jgi:basic amino acid/polyamine antiporter, APA family
MSHPSQQLVPSGSADRTDTTAAAPKPVVTIVDAMALTVGIVIGAGIFRTPSLVAANSHSEWVVYLAWSLGGVISVIGALVYSELATTYPHAGGDYHYLTRAFGHRLSFLFAWARMSVIQTGSITFSLFVFGDYAGRILSLGEYSSAIYAGLAIAVLTGINILGVREGTGTQNLLTSFEVFGVILVIAAGLIVAAPAPQTAAASASPAASSSLGLIMVFVLLTYGGWSEAAYVSAELRDVRRNMVRVLLLSILLITVLYLLINWAYLHALGLGGTAQAEQVAAAVMNRAFGAPGAVIISVLVAISALTTANATIFTGARTSYAFGCDFPAFRFLGRWSPRTSTPVNALLLQGGIAMALVLFGVVTRRGFETIVEYTAPVYWFFILLTGISLFVLRRKEARITRPFHVPFYPVTPALFCLAATYLLYSSLAYTGIGAFAGVVVLAVGAIMLLFIHPSTSDQGRHEGGS